MTAPATCRLAFLNGRDVSSCDGVVCPACQHPVTFFREQLDRAARNGFTVSRIAELCGVSVRHARSWFLSTNRPRPEEAVVLGLMLRCEVDAKILQEGK